MTVRVGRVLGPVRRVPARLASGCTPSAVRRALADPRVLGNTVGRLAMFTLTTGFICETLLVVRVAGVWMPRPVLWAPEIVTVLPPSFATLWMARHTPGMAPRVRRFWQRFAVGLMLLVVAQLLNAWNSLTAPLAESTKETVPNTALYLISVLVILYALLRLPVARRTASQQLTLGLDTSIVMVSAGLLGWHFILIETLGPGGEIGAFGIVGAGFAAALVVLKVAMSDTSQIAPRALRVLGTTAGLATVGGALGPLLSRWPEANDAILVAPVTSAGVLLVALIQYRAGEGSRPQPVRRRRHTFSSLPYAAIAVVNLLLLGTAFVGGGLDRGLLIGSVLVTGLVVVRQLISVRENTRLLARLDVSMKQVSRQEEWFRSLVLNSSDITTVIDRDGRLAYVSPGLKRSLGYRPEEWLGRSPEQWLHPDDIPALGQLFAGLRSQSGSVRNVQVRMRHAEGGWRWFDITLTNLTDDPNVGGVVSNGRDITENHRYQEQLAYQATHDELTDLANRSLFAEHTNRAVARRDAPGRVTVALVDLDDFKIINDALGHAVGDAVLVSVAERLRGCVRPADTVARLGGDEFGLLLAEMDPLQSAAVAERILTELSEPVSAAGHQLLIQASIGLAESTPDSTAEDLLRRADLAMYAAKELGKSRYVHYDAELDARAVEHAELAAQLTQAIDRGELHLLYQPIVSLPEGRIVDVEALVRWRHPVEGVVPPIRFIPVAERTGLIVQMGAWILATACRQEADWLRRYGSAAPERISVNVSARQLLEPEFPQMVASVLAVTGLPAERLTIEITETAVFNGGRAAEAVVAVHDLGVRIALDDFGTGHSSLGLLRSCPVDVLKVDKSFVDGVTGTVEQEAIVTSIDEIAQALRLDAIAEGVETGAQADRLHGLGYRYAQGYHFARPLSEPDLERMFTVAAAREQNPVESRTPGI